MSLTQLSCDEFVKVLASKAPTPGGGGASALVGAVGVALSNMVGSLTAGKKKYADVESEIISLQQQCDQLQSELLDLVAQDAAAFEPLSQAYALPKDTDEQKAHRAQVLSERCLVAANVPLQIMEKCYAACQLAHRYAEIGSKLAVSDAGCSAYFLTAAVNAARLNVLINLPMLQDLHVAAELNAKADQLMDDAQQLCEETIAIVCMNM